METGAESAWGQGAQAPYPQELHWRQRERRKKRREEVEGAPLVLELILSKYK